MRALPLMAEKTLPVSPQILAAECDRDPAAPRNPSYKWRRIPLRGSADFIKSGNKDIGHLSSTNLPGRQVEHPHVGPYNCAHFDCSVLESLIFRQHDPPVLAHFCEPLLICGVRSKALVVNCNSRSGGAQGTRHDYLSECTIDEIGKFVRLLQELARSEWLLRFRAERGHNPLRVHQQIRLPCSALLWQRLEFRFRTERVGRMRREGQ